jgi:hypothetical protein
MTFSLQEEGRMTVDCLLYAAKASRPSVVPVPVDKGCEKSPRVADLHPFGLLHCEILWAIREDRLLRRREVRGP